MERLRVIIFFLALLLMAVSCSDKKQKQVEAILKPKKKVLNIKIRYEDMFTTTFLSVDCADFEKTFLKMIKEKYLSSDNKLKFEGFLNEVLKMNKVKENIDTRVKATMYYSDKTVKEICIGLHTLEIDGVKYSIPKDFTKYLLDITDTKQ